MLLSIAWRTVRFLPSLLLSSLFLLPLLRRLRLRVRVALRVRSVARCIFAVVDHLYILVARLLPSHIYTSSVGRGGGGASCHSIWLGAAAGQGSPAECQQALGNT